MTMNLRYLKIIITAITLFIASCGNDNEAPVGGQILINPSGLDIGYPATLTPCQGYFDPIPLTALVASPVMWKSSLFRVSILNENGLPIPGAKFTATIPFTGSNNTDELAWIFDDLNGDGLIEVFDVGVGSYIPDATELVSGMGDPVGFESETNGAGYKEFYILFDLACGWSGSLFIYSGAISEKVEIKLELS